MKKFFILLGSIVFLSLPALADDFGPGDNGPLFPEKTPVKNAYARLKRAYDQGQPARFLDFPSLNQCMAGQHYVRLGVSLLPGGELDPSISPFNDTDLFFVPVPDPDSASKFVNFVSTDSCLDFSNPPDLAKQLADEDYLASETRDGVVIEYVTNREYDTHIEQTFRVSGDSVIVRYKARWHEPKSLWYKSFVEYTYYWPKKRERN